MSDNDFLAILVACIAACVLASRLVEIVRMRTRSENIKSAGWPPSRLDADGDPVGWTNTEE